MRIRAARYPLLLGLSLSPALAAAQSKPGSLPAVPDEKPASKAAPQARPNEKPAAPAPAKPSSPPPSKSAAGQPATSPPSGKAAADVARGAGARSVSPPSSAAKALPAVKAEPADKRASAAGDDTRRGKEDPELSQLREAERVLFPRPLEGVELGFDFGVRAPQGPEIDTSGLPAGTASHGETATSGAAANEAGWLRGLVQPDLPVRYDERVVRYLRFYRDSPSGRAIARAWVKKSGRYAAAIKTELSRAGLPSDLLWLSLIESSHNPTIVSPAGAAGLWQFMPDAARSYGLTVDRWVDERLDPERATQAAIRYLSDLYRRFGTWDLAMAAYNMGYGGLSRSVRKFNTNSFWELSRYEAGIPWETTLYVPKILATAVLMNNRRAFGLDGVTEDAPERFDVVLVGPSTPLSEIARAVGAAPATLEALNPQYLAGRTPPVAPGALRGSYRVRVPEGSGGNWNPVRAQVDEGLESYVVRAGETMERIARARGASERELREKNRVAAGETLAPGTVLLVPRATRAEEPDPTTAAEVVVVPSRNVDVPQRKRVFYRVVSGDTVAGVAGAFRVTAEELADWNTLDAQARLEPGMSLQVFVAKDADLSKVLHVPEAHAKVLVAGSPEFCEHFEGQNGRKRLVIAARDGDTLGAIGKRYGMTVGQMERINRRGRGDQLAAGERVVVYTERERPAPGDTLLTVNN